MSTSCASSTASASFPCSASKIVTPVFRGFGEAHAIDLQVFRTNTRKPSIEACPNLQTFLHLGPWLVRKDNT